MRLYKAIMRYIEQRKPEGYEPTGEFRTPRRGELYLNTSGWISTAGHNHASYEHYQIMRPKETIKMTELKAPEGFELTGEERVPMWGVWYMGESGNARKDTIGGINSSYRQQKILRLRRYLCSDGVTRVWDEKEERVPNGLEWFIGKGELGACFEGVVKQHNSGRRKILVSVAGEKENTMDNLKEGVDYVLDADGQRVFVGDYVCGTRDADEQYKITKSGHIMSVVEIAMGDMRISFLGRYENYGVDPKHFIRTTPELFEKSKKKNGEEKIGMIGDYNFKAHYKDGKLDRFTAGCTSMHPDLVAGLARQVIKLYEAAK